MSYCVTTALERISELDKRITVIQGGTSAGKTIAVLILLLNYALEHKNEVITIVTDTFPNLRTGAMRDWLKICQETNVDKLAQWNKSEHQMTFPNGTIVEFYSVDTMGALGSRRDVLFVNEANRIAWETFSNLEVRTKERVIIDFNPVNEFWAHKELIGREDVDFIKLTYQDNEALDKNIIKALEMRRGDGTSNWWRVYGLGEIGSLEGNIYSGWTTVDAMPEGFVLKRYGVDFGFSNDPTAVVAVYENDEGSIFLDTKVCETKLLTPELITKLQQLPEGLFVCDNARPEIIAEMQRAGIRAIPCDKTPGEKLNGKRYNIELVLRRKVYYLSTDKELEREYLTYAWRKKKTGEIVDEPEDGNDHILDALAYAVRDLERKPIEYATPR